MRLELRPFNMLELIYSLKHEPFSLTLFSIDSVTDVDDDDEVNKSFKPLIAPENKMFSRKMQILRKITKKRQKSNKKDCTRYESKSKRNLAN